MESRDAVSRLRDIESVSLSRHELTIDWLQLTDDAVSRYELAYKADMQWVVFTCGKFCLIYVREEPYLQFNLNLYTKQAISKIQG